MCPKFHTNPVLKYAKCHIFTYLSNFLKLCFLYCQNLCALAPTNRRFAEESRLSGNTGWHPQTMSKYLFVKYLLISKQTGTQVELFKKMDFGGPRGGWHPQTMSKYLCVKYLLISKTTSTLARAVQKMDFLGPHFGRGARWSCPIQFREKKLHLQLNNFTQKLDFDVLWFMRRAYKN